MSDMHRTQLLLPRKLWEKLRRRASEEGRSASDLMRDAAERYLSDMPEQVDWTGDALLDIVGGARSGAGDLSERHDDYLYGPQA